MPGTKSILVQGLVQVLNLTARVPGMEFLDEGEQLTRIVVRCVAAARTGCEHDDGKQNETS